MSTEVADPHIFAMGIISGAAACYWLVFTCYWTYTYVNAKEERSQLHGGWFFYTSALLYLATSVAYFTAYSLSAWGTLQGFAIWAFRICYVLYMPLAYLLGTNCCLGFGTLHTKNTAGRSVVLASVWALVTAACLLMLIGSNLSQLVGEVVFIAALAVQVTASLFTLRRFRKVRRFLTYKGHSALAITLMKSFTQFCIISLLFSLLFAFHTSFVTLYEVRKLVGKTEYMSLWAGFVVTTAVVNSWVLLRLRPSDFLWDVDVMAEVYEAFSEDSTVYSEEV